jgi:hypothetical protein
MIHHILVLKVKIKGRIFNFNFKGDIIVFEFLIKETYGEVATYFFTVFNTNREELGKAVIVVGGGRHDAGLVFKKDIRVADVYDTIEDFRQLLEWDLIKIDEPHEKIILAEISYK